MRWTGGGDRNCGREVLRAGRSVPSVLRCPVGTPPQGQRHAVTDAAVRVARTQPPARGRQRRSSRVFETTLTLDSAIAAPASTGSSRPAAASGMPTTL